MLPYTRIGCASTIDLSAIPAANHSMGQARTKSKGLCQSCDADMRLPDRREEIAQCGRQGKMHDACMVRYVDLMPR